MLEGWRELERLVRVGERWKVYTDVFDLLNVTFVRRLLLLPNEMVKSEFFFRDFNKDKLKKHIQELLKNYDFNQEFESELISDLIAEKHYYCACHELRPLRFRKEYYPGRLYNFCGLFLNLGWHPISWNDCIYPDSREKIIKGVLRKAIEPVISEYKRQHPNCERCGKPSKEVDHVDPEFDVIAQQALKMLSDTEWESIMLSSFNFLNKEEFRLPDNNPALIYTLEAHKTTELQAVCKKCHLINAKERKENKKNQ